MQKVKLEISGMSCGHCVSAVSKALTSVSGVDIIDVDVGSAAIMIDAQGDPKDSTTLGKAIDAIARAGFEATAQA